MYQPHRMKFGIFMAPFHRVGENPTLALKRDMHLIEHLDALGYDEVWIGEHHSYARELIAEWRDDYNRRRPHTSLRGLTPAGFASRSNPDHSNDGLSL